MTKILVLNRSAVGRNMASSGARAWHIARTLAEELPDARVTLSAPDAPDVESPHPHLTISPFGNALSGLFQIMRHDVIIARNFPPQALVAFLLGKRLVLDFFTWFFIEWMEFSKRFDSYAQRDRWMATNRRYLEFQLMLADYMFCSNSRQRDVFIGTLSGLGLITPRTYDEDSTLSRFLSVIPYGLRSERPQHKRRVLKGVVPGIHESDTVVLWNGAIVEWFDAQTVIRAMTDVAKQHDDIKLFFLGIDHPDDVSSPAAPPVREAIELSKELGLYERTVFFNTGWIPYEDLDSYLLEADIGVSAGFDNLEARYAQRTRFVDLFWAELPIVTTRGDEISEDIEREPLGFAVPPGDASAFAEAILRLANNPELYKRCRENLARAREEMTWERVLMPLVEFCRTGKSAAVSRRQRLVPLLWRTLLYVLSKPLTPRPPQT